MIYKVLSVSVVYALCIYIYMHYVYIYIYILYIYIFFFSHWRTLSAFPVMFLTLTGGRYAPPSSVCFLLAPPTLSQSLSQLCCKVTCESVLFLISYFFGDHCEWSPWHLRHEPVSQLVACWVGFGS